MQSGERTLPGLAWGELPRQNEFGVAAFAETCRIPLPATGWETIAPPNTTASSASPRAATRREGRRRANSVPPGMAFKRRDRRRSRSRKFLARWDIRGRLGVVLVCLQSIRTAETCSRRDTNGSLRNHVHSRNHPGARQDSPTPA